MKKSLIVAAMATAGLSACGGGGSGGSTNPSPSLVSGLELPTTMSVVTASDGGGSLVKMSLAQLLDDQTAKLVALSLWSPCPASFIATPSPSQHTLAGNFSGQEYVR